MAKPDLLEEDKKRGEEAGGSDLLIAVATPANVEQLRRQAGEALRLSAPAEGPAPEGSLADLRVAVAFPSAGAAPEPANDAANDGDGLPRPFPIASPSAPSVIPWLGAAATYQAVFHLARELGVSACVVIASDLAALRADPLRSLIEPVLAKRCDLVMPVYPMGKFEGLLNSGILAPLTRALYGRRVRFPLALDFAVSAQMLPELEQAPRRMVLQGKTLFWPATEAALRQRSVCQTYFNVNHSTIVEGVDLSTVLAQTVGPLFAEMEVNAAIWQRVRGSQPLEIAGSPTALPPDGAAVDVRPMLETFILGFRNLQEIWSLVLPPVTLLELKRLTRLSAEQFRMPDDLWVRIVYDFGLAYRLRTLSRIHLLGAMTPLYLGWAASHVLEVGAMRSHEAGQRVERLARAYEEGKPYLLSRWRWPDRFNP